MSTRNKKIVIAELKKAIADWEAKANQMGDAGGLQGYAVLATDPELDARIKRLAKEAEALGITERELQQ